MKVYGMKGSRLFLIFSAICMDPEGGLNCVMFIHLLSIKRAKNQRFCFETSRILCYRDHTGYVRIDDAVGDNVRDWFVKFKSPGNFLENPWVAMILIAVTVLVIYSNVYDGPFVFDGKLQIEDKIKIRDLNNYSSLRGFFSHRRPLTGFSFALNYRMGGLEPFGYHLVNILIHAANGMLAYLLALCVFGRLSSSPPKSTAVKCDEQKSVPLAERLRTSSTSNHIMALLAALIFVAHPIQTQSVTYIVQRYTSMSALFYLASVLFYIQARKLQVAPKSRPQKKINPPQLNENKPATVFFRVFVCFFFFVFLGILAILCKENAATLFGVILLVEYFLFDRTWAGWRKKLIWLLPITSLLAVAIIYYFASTRGLRFGNLLEDVSILTRETSSVDRFSYLCTQFTVFVFYVRLLFFPVGQNIDYMLPFNTGFFDGFTPLAFLVVLVVLGVAFWNIRKRPVVSFGIFWFFITLSIESSIFPISDAIFEHRLYLPMFGFAVALVYGIFDLFNGRTAWAVTILAAAILALSIGTYLRNRVWQDPLILWSDVVSKSPHNHRAHYNLGNVMQRRGQLADAQAQYEKALELKPSFAVAHDNLGLVLMKKGRLSEAMEHSGMAVHIKPGNATIQNNFGQILLKQGRIKEAADHFSRAVRISPAYAKAQNNLGIALAQQQKLGEAKKHLLTAARLDPNNSEIQNNLGQVFMLQGNYGKAANHFEVAIQLNPDFAQAQTNLGFMRLKQQKPDEAAQHFLKALKINPGIYRARQGLKQATKTTGGWGPRK